MAKSSVSTLKALFHAANVLIVWCLVVGLNDILFETLSGNKSYSSSSSGFVDDSGSVPKST